MALLKAQDVPDLLGRAVSEAQFEVALKMATAAIKAYIGTDPDTFIGTRSAWLPVAADGSVRLPLVTWITAVETADGLTAVPFTYRTGRVLTIDPLLYLTEVKVTYRYTTVPSEISTAALYLVLEIIGTQTSTGGLSAGIRSETTSIDDYTRSVTYSDGSATGNGLPAAVRELLRGYRSGLQSVRLRAG